MAKVNWSNYTIGCSMDGKIRIARGKIDNRLGGMFVASDKSGDLTAHAVEAVKDHMQRHLSGEEDTLKIVFSDGSKLIFEKAGGGAE